MSANAVSGKAIRGSDQKLPFKIDKVTLYGYKAFEKFEVELGALNVVIGVNGSGKTSLVRGVGLGLDELVRRIGPRVRPAIRPDIHELRRGRAWIGLDLCVKGVDYAIRRSFHTVDKSFVERPVLIHQQGEGEPNSPEAPRRVATLGAFYWEALAQNENIELPLLCLFPIERAVVDVPLRIREIENFARRDAYKEAFNSSRNFRSFFAWFRAQEDIENAMRIRESRGYRDPLLEAVRSAIYSALPGYTNLRVDRTPLRMRIDKHGQSLSIQQLSDGERSILALIGDIAKRCAILNPQMAVPTESPGCVLIDEIDQHLHPQWQTQILGVLPRVFPNIQFIVTTHSPLVASSVRADHLIVIRDGKPFFADPYGQDTVKVLDEIFATKDRPKAIQQLISEFESCLETEQFDKIDAAATKLEQYLPSDDPVIVRANVMRAFFSANRAEK